MKFSCPASSKVFLVFLNSLYPSIEFILEVGESRINLLNLTITSLPSGFELEIYRKNNPADILIHDSSFCSLPHKLAAFHYFIQRLVSLPLSLSAFTEEASILKITILHFLSFSSAFCKNLYWIKLNLYAFWPLCFPEFLRFSYGAQGTVQIVEACCLPTTRSSCPKTKTNSKAMYSH